MYLTISRPCTTFYVYLQDTTKKFLSKMGKWKNSSGVVESCVTNRWQCNAGTTELFILDDVVLFRQWKEKLFPKADSGWHSRRLCMLVATSKTHKVRAIALSITNYMALQQGLKDKHPSIFDIISEEGYQVLITPTEFRKNAQRRKAMLFDTAEVQPFRDSGEIKISKTQSTPT